MYSIAIFFPIKLGKQSIKINGQDWEGLDYTGKIAYLAFDSLFESGALQLSNELSVDQICQKFLTFLEWFRTEYPKWADISAPRRNPVNLLPSCTLWHNDSP